MEISLNGRHTKAFADFSLLRLYDTKAPRHRCQINKPPQSWPVSQELLPLLVNMHFLAQRQRRFCNMLALDNVPGRGHALWMHLYFGDRRSST